MDVLFIISSFEQLTVLHKCQRLDSNPGSLVLEVTILQLCRYHCPTINDFYPSQTKRMNKVKWKGINFHVKKISPAHIGMQNVCLSVGINWITFDWMYESWLNFHSQWTTKVVLLVGAPTP